MSPPEPLTSTRAAAALFEVLWNELVGLLGTPATAALMRRAIKRASAGRAEVAWPVIHREGLEYSHGAPPSWQDPSGREALDALRRLVRDHLFPLVQDLTGAVITRRLGHVPALVEAGLADREES